METVFCFMPSDSTLHATGSIHGKSQAAMLSVMMSWGSGDAGFQHDPKAPCRYYLQGLGPDVGIIYRARAPAKEEWNNDNLKGPRTQVIGL